MGVLTSKKPVQVSPLSLGLIPLYASRCAVSIPIRYPRWLIPPRGYHEQAHRSHHQPCEVLLKMSQDEAFFFP